MAGKPRIWLGLNAEVRELENSSYGEGNAIEVKDGETTVAITAALVRKLAGMVR